MGTNDRRRRCTRIPSASDDLVVHTVVWLSMACLCFGVLYAVILGFEFRKFGNTAEGNKTKELDWIREVTLPPTNNFWNPRIMLSMPAVWIIWGVIYFAVFMISFLWRTNEKGEDSESSPIQQKGPRIVTTVIGFVGAVYLGLIIRDLKRIESGDSYQSLPIEL
ncbi:hypothetical protein DFH09DRAFT_1187897 [Mycena vulgaris]|nr:hypothetical protein DFH09DRAFT_1187897 [Mycena vulgaris]